ncbi:MAG: CusA/CzcA family heavy metal efflux RND transporter, partial [Gammaproteobacteria bacterium]|nr:CusA/CzcA family heavy metal efflux RND transporter [Gammaproteobacteria bacterium]
LVDISGRDLGSYVAEAQRVVAAKLELPTGYSIAWSGQYEYLVRAKQRLSIVVPLTLGIIMLLLYINFRNVVEVLIIMGTLPFALIGGIWLVYLLGYEMSVAVGVGFIALAGVTVEIGVLMLVYLNLAFSRARQQALHDNRELSRDEIRNAVIQGAGRRVRPIMMTFAAIVVGLIPIMLGEGTGSEVMQRIAGPMIGGMISSLILTLLVIPAIYFLWKSNARIASRVQLSQQEA